MNILIISNMYPSVQKPYSGLFVVNQINEIKSQVAYGDEIDFYYMKRTFTRAIGSLIKYTKFFLGFMLFCLRTKKKYDIVHVHYFYPTIYLGLIYKFFFNREAKIVVTFHGGDYYKTRKNYLYKYSFKRIDKVIAVSENLKNSLKEFYPQEIAVIPAGINTIFQVSKENQLKVYDLIYVGSFYKVKGFDLLCDFLRNHVSSLRVCIIGSGELESLLHSVRENTTHQIDLYNNLKQIEIVNKLQQSRFLVNTSRNESFGLSMTESMACGIPVIATITDGSSEQIKNNYNGLLVKEHSANKFTAKVEEALGMNENEYLEMSNNALKNSEKYKLPEIASRVIKEYKNLLQE